MIQAIIDYLQASLTFIPDVYIKEYKNKIFKEILRCLKLTTDKNDINIMRPKLISSGSSIANIDTLKQLYEQTYTGLSLTFTVEEKWRIMFRIYSSDFYSC